MPHCSAADLVYPDSLAALQDEFVKQNIQINESF